MEHKVKEVLRYPRRPRLNRIEPTSLYVVEGNFNSTSSGGVTLPFTSFTALCASGDVLYTGGFTILNSGIVDIVTDFPLAAFKGWSINIRR
jgi:hypothetical protein